MSARDCSERHPSEGWDDGFTLIETLVALAIFSLAALALLRLEGATVSSAAMLEDHAVAQIVARNLAVQLLTDPRPPAIGAAQGSIVNAGRRWGWARTTRRTDDARIVRIDLSVRDDRMRQSAALMLARPTE